MENQADEEGRKQQRSAEGVIDGRKVFSPGGDGSVVGSWMKESRGRPVVERTEGKPPSLQLVSFFV